MENEKIYRALGRVGASGITVGIIMITVGLSTGIISIVSGARALKCKKKMMI